MRSRTMPDPFSNELRGPHTDRPKYSSAASSRILAGGRTGSLSEYSARPANEAVTIAAGKAVSCQQVPHPHAAAGGAARYADLVVACQRQQQEPGVLERNAGRLVHFYIGLVGVAQQRAGLERAHPVVRFDAARAAANEPIHEKQTGQLRRLKIEFRIAEEERRLPR